MSIDAELPFESSWSGAYLDIEAGDGYLTASYNEAIGIFLIADIKVDRLSRRQGIGKQLLRQALGEAQKVQAKAVVASIVSRECLEAMQVVFGEESLTIDSIGPYLGSGDLPPAGDQKTSAGLWYQLPNSS